MGGEPETNSRAFVPSQEKAAFRELITQLELDPKCRGLPLSSFLILPFQRVTRLKLLVQVRLSHPPGRPGSCRLLLPDTCFLRALGLRRLSAFEEVCLFLKS